MKDVRAVRCYDNRESNIIGGGDYDIPEMLNFPDNGDISEPCLGVYVFFHHYNDLRRVQLINCIMSLKLQSFINIDICIINLDVSKEADSVCKEVARNLGVSYLASVGRNASSMMNYVVSTSLSTFITFIECFDVMPRVYDVENAMYQLYTNELDYLSFTVKYKYDNDAVADVDEAFFTSALATNQNFHYSAYFRRSVLAEYKFDVFAPVALDKRMISAFEQTGRKGAFILGQAPMTIIDEIGPEVQCCKVAS